MSTKVLKVMPLNMKGNSVSLDIWISFFLFLRFTNSVGKDPLNMIKVGGGGEGDTSGKRGREWYDRCRLVEGTHISVILIVA